MNAPQKPDLLGPGDVPDISARPSFFGTGKIYPPLAETEEERDASWRRFLELANAGYRSEGRRMTRDEMNER